MKTIERTHHDVPSPTTTDRPGSAGRRTGIFVLVAVLALILGAVGGWVVRGSDDVSDASIVLAGDGELTARQEQMVDMIDEAIAAWQRGDGDGAAAMFTPAGTVTLLGTTYRVDDGSLADYVDGSSYAALNYHSPMLVHGNTVLSFHDFNGQTYTNVFDFTANGELLMVQHTVSG